VPEAEAHVDGDGYAACVEVLVAELELQGVREIVLETEYAFFESASSGVEGCNVGYCGGWVVVNGRFQGCEVSKLLD